MKLFLLLKLSTLVVGDKRLERKEIDISKLDQDFEDDDDMEIDELPDFDQRKRKEGMETNKLRGDDHISVWAQSKKGKQFGLHVEPVPGLYGKKVTW